MKVALFLLLSLICGVARSTGSLCQEKWFEEDVELLQNKRWGNTMIGVNGNRIRTLNGGTSEFPYYRYDLSFENVSIDFLYNIEGPDYPTASKNWIPQLIKGETVECGDPYKKYCPQYLAYSFWPTPFSDRDVCQICCTTKTSSIADIQMAVRTVPFKYCDSVSNETLVHMTEHVAKFFWVNGTQIRFTYLGSEDPGGNFPAWFMKLSYPWAYSSHIKSYVKYVKRSQEV